MQTLYFSHPLSHEPIYFNETTQYRDHTLVVNRVLFDAQLEYEQIASWNYLLGFKYTAGSELVMEERDGARVPLRSTCPRSSCSAEVARRAQAGETPKLKDSLKSIGVLVYTICAGLALMCLVSIMFFMTPNPFACFSRRILFPVAIATIFGPITIKSICIWRADLLTDRGDVRQAVGGHSVLTFWLCAAIVLVQLVVSIEWAVFEPASEMTYVVSLRHGNAWRCTPGDDVSRNF
ncbi:hypothetical protein OESDEN_09336 [Oesophagostomum dentatum]|uniref:G-protein coupled receptors family 3 profile domain-containing protein n=1 Tax=Oesophagostomum dentatum TaxID=61180 RepID=A0A0B1T4T8_OESDE|nr:hypothetical protein OESDEN_09336 [Oesophagostomum dentatum]